MIPPPPTLFGIKLRTFVLMFWTLFFGLIFTMTMWPRIWKKIYEKKRLKNIELKKSGKLPEKSKVNLKLIVLVIVLAAAMFFLGSLYGFDEAVDQIPTQQCGTSSECVPFYCSDLGISTCQDCRCFLCEDSVRIEVSLPNQ